MEWLLAPIDPSRAHDVSVAISWHGRFMVIAWGVLAPLAVVIARFFKILPGQDWPRECDSQVWWRAHWMGQTIVIILSLCALAFVLPVQRDAMGLHNWLGFLLFASLALQVLLGMFRGSKGGPTAPARDGSLHGHHYDMTPWRRAFETLHKTLGYSALALAAIVIMTGLWKANAPVWMWVSIMLWWGILIAVFVQLQKRGMAVDTYQAIWGADPRHPGNRLPHPGWGVMRPGDHFKGGIADVRSNRGHGI
ncbi:MAG: cytochrome b561 domain-containing protein [Pseudomonadota bacterium]